MTFYKVVVKCTAIVEAESPEEAEEAYFDGDIIDSEEKVIKVSRALYGDLSS